MVKIPSFGCRTILNKSLFLLLALLASSSVFAFGGGGKKEMFDEPWMKGVDAFGVYFGGDDQADIKFECDDPNATPNNKGVCNCKKGYKQEDGLCYADACANFKQNGCRTACTSYHGSATYTICRGTGTCKSNDTCDYSTQIDCNPACGDCYACDTSVGQCKWDDSQTGLSCGQAYELKTCVKNSGCVAKQCGSDKFLAQDGQTCHSCTDPDSVNTTKEQCESCGNTREIFDKIDTETHIIACQLKNPSGCSSTNRTACNQDNCSSLGQGYWCYKEYYIGDNLSHTAGSCVANKDSCGCDSPYEENSGGHCVKPCDTDTDCDNNKACRLSSNNQKACVVVCPTASEQQVCHSYAVVNGPDGRTCQDTELSTGTCQTATINDGVCVGGSCVAKQPQCSEIADNCIECSGNTCTKYQCAGDPPACKKCDTTTGNFVNDNEATCAGGNGTCSNGTCTCKNRFAPTPNSDGSCSSCAEKFGRSCESCTDTECTVYPCIGDAPMCQTCDTSTGNFITDDTVTTCANDNGTCNNGTCTCKDGFKPTPSNGACTSCTNAFGEKCLKCSDHECTEYAPECTQDTESTDCDNGYKCVSNHCVSACQDEDMTNPCKNYVAPQHTCQEGEDKDDKTPCTTNDITDGLCVKGICTAKNEVCIEGALDGCNDTDCGTAGGYWCVRRYIAGSQEISANRCVANEAACICEGTYEDKDYRPLVNSPDEQTTSELVCAVCSDDYLQLCTQDECPTTCEGEACPEVNMYSWNVQEGGTGICQKCTLTTYDACSQEQCAALGSYTWDQDHCIPQTTCEAQGINCGDWRCNSSTHMCENPCSESFSPTQCHLARYAEGGVCKNVNAENGTPCGTTGNVCKDGACVCPSEFTETIEPNKALYTYTTCLGDEGLRYHITGCAECASQRQSAPGDDAPLQCEADPNNHGTCSAGTCANGTCYPTCEENKYVSLQDWSDHQGHFQENTATDCATSDGVQKVVKDCTNVLDLTVESELFTGDVPNSPVFCYDGKGAHIVDVLCDKNYYFNRETKTCEAKCPQAQQSVCTGNKWTCTENRSQNPTITTSEPCGQNAGNDLFCNAVGFCQCKPGFFFGKVANGTLQCYSCDDENSNIIPNNAAACNSCGTKRTILGAYCIPTCQEGRFMDVNGACHDCTTGTANTKEYKTKDEQACTVCNNNGVLRNYSTSDQYCVLHSCDATAAAKEFRDADAYCRSCRDEKPYAVPTSTAQASCVDRCKITQNNTTTTWRVLGPVDEKGNTICMLNNCGTGKFRDINGNCHSCDEEQDVTTASADQCGPKCSSHRYFEPSEGSDSGLCKLKKCDAQTCNGFCDINWDCHSCDDYANSYQVADDADCTVCSNRAVVTDSNKKYCYQNSCPMGYMNDTTTSNHKKCIRIQEGTLTCNTSADCPGAYYCLKSTLSAAGVCRNMTGGIGAAGTQKAILSELGLVYRSPGISLPYNAINWCDALNDPNNPGYSKDWSYFGVDELRIPPEYRDTQGKPIKGTWRIFEAADFACYDNTNATTPINIKTRTALFCCEQYHDRACNTNNDDGWANKSSILRELKDAFSDDFAGGTTRKGYWLNRTKNETSTSFYTGYRLNINPLSYSTYGDIYGVASGTSNDTGYSARTPTSGSGITNSNLYALCQFCPETCPELGKKKHFHPENNDCVCKTCSLENIQKASECTACGGTWFDDWGCVLPPESS